ncbi:MAG TPA: hypothetical protein VG245_11710 [Candidatus Dormibacteraeota bacterium]|jgi:hypothetical protein|nr:hypothetical protein [Candidatus Dormibacteraeota bacterium]
MKTENGLRLSRETVRNLNPEDLGGAGGGQNIPTTQTQLTLCICATLIRCIAIADGSLLCASGLVHCLP